MTRRRNLEPPVWLGEAGAAEWRRVVPALLKQDHFDFDLDRITLEAYAAAVEALAGWRALNETQRPSHGSPEWKRTGREVTARSEAVWARVNTDLAERRVVHLATELGLTPASRAGIYYRSYAGR